MSTPATTKNDRARTVREADAGRTDRETDGGRTDREADAGRTDREADAGRTDREADGARAVGASAGLATRPKRADARRNYDKLIAAAREAFTEEDRSASLEDIARRAGVGIGTLYRHFPTRADLIEAVYVEEVETLCRSAEELSADEPWEALVSWLHRFVGYVATKQALADELFAADRDAEVFTRCRVACYDAGEPLLARAQAAGEVRPDTNIDDVVRIVGGIAKMTSEPADVERVLGIALDGLRYGAR